jgi:hypothetical protein
MSTISKIATGASRTVNLGNFESLRIEAQVTVDVDLKAGSLLEAEEMAQKELRKLLEQTYLDLMKKGLRPEKEKAA